MKVYQMIKNSIKILWLILIGVLGFVPFSTAKTKITIAIGEWPPYVSEELKHEGVAVHMVKEAFALAGVEAQCRFYPWMRVHEYVKTGEADASILWVWTEERAQHFYFSDIVIEGTAVFFHLKSDPFDWTTFKDLENRAIGGLVSASYPWFEQAKEQGLQLHMKKVIDEKQNFEKLFKKRIDLISLDRLVGYTILRKYFDPQAVQLVTEHPRPIETWQYRLIFSKQNKQSPHLVELFNKGFKRFKEQGLDQKYMKDAEMGKYLK
jgi:polar amino acid transport system substrate-binding protein